jgi:DNA polymerase-3 subunit alpha
LNRKSLEALISAGAFDSLNSNRAALMMAIDSALDFAKAMNETKDTGMESLFGEEYKQEITEPQLPNVSDWHEKKRLQHEKEVLNFFLTGHPLNSYLPYLTLLSDIKLGEKGKDKNGMSVKVCGMVTNVRTKLDKNNNTIAFIMLEDFSGKCEVIFWSEAYAKSKDFLTEDAIIVVYGKVQADDESMKIVSDYAQTVEVAAKQHSKGYNIWIDLDTPDNVIDEFHRSCTDINSENVVLFNVYSKKQNYKSVYAAYNINIGFSEAKVGRMIEIFGRNNVRLLRKY